MYVIKGYLCVFLFIRRRSYTILDLHYTVFKYGRYHDFRNLRFHEIPGGKPGQVMAYHPRPTLQLSTYKITYTNKHTTQTNNQQR